MTSNDLLTLLSIVFVMVVIYKVVLSRPAPLNLSSLLHQAAQDYLTKLEEVMDDDRARISILERQRENDSRLIAELQGWLDERDKLVNVMREELGELRGLIQTLELENERLRGIERLYIELLERCGEVDEFPSDNA